MPTPARPPASPPGAGGTSPGRAAWLDAPDATAVMRRLAGAGRVIVCCGSGGVGKTTTAAALALAAAMHGRRACVVTIDPARRLANALGLGTLSNSAALVEGDWPGELWALMLDARATFDELVVRHASSSAQADRILANRLYRTISSSLGGTQEYMASEKLYDLSHDRRFDVVVVDTPPTRNALDFLDSPGRLARFLENRLFRLLLLPTRAYLRAVSVATQALLRTFSKVAGAELVSDAVEFFQAFEGMEEGFRQRAKQVEQLLADPDTAFVLVASPRRDSIEEATYFAMRLARSQIGVAALVVNRLHPDFRRIGRDASAAATSGDGRAPDAPREGTAGTGAEPVAGREALSALRTNLASFEAIAKREEGYFTALVHQVSPAPVARVPFLGDDVHDVEGLALVARYLVDERPGGEAVGARRARGQQVAPRKAVRPAGESSAAPAPPDEPVPPAAG